MKAVFTVHGLMIQFSIKENEIGAELLRTLAEMYEAEGVDASPIQNVIDALEHKETIQ